MSLGLWESWDILSHTEWKTTVQKSPSGAQVRFKIMNLYCVEPMWTWDFLQQYPAVWEGRNRATGATRGWQNKDSEKPMEGGIP